MANSAKKRMLLRGLAGEISDTRSTVHRHLNEAEDHLKVEYNPGFARTKVRDTIRCLTRLVEQCEYVIGECSKK